MGSAAAIELDAELTIAQVETWHQRLALDDLDPSGVMIDATKLDRVDAAGLQLLVAFRAACKIKGVSVAVFNVPKPIQELIRVAGLSQALS